MSAVLGKEHLKVIDDIHKIIDNSNKITITTHVNPDGDAIGSTLAFYHYLKSKNKECRIIIHSPVPYNYRFLKDSSLIDQYSTDHDEFITKSDSIFVIDLNDIERTKSPAEIIKQSKAVKAVIDHHIDPKDFADHYFVDTSATSAGELVYHVLNQDSSYIISKEVAECLYTAIMTDTGSFRFPRTDGNLHRIIAGLIDHGADPVMLFENIYNIRPARVVKLLGEAFAGLETMFNGKLCVLQLSVDQFKRAGAFEEDVEDIVEQSLTIHGVVIGVLLSECLSKNEIRVSLRSKGEISVRDIAVKFNGGGHKNAAGARFFNTSLHDAKSSVINEISKTLKITD